MVSGGVVWGEGGGGEGRRKALMIKGFTWWSVSGVVWDWDGQCGF